ncbi:MAG: diguanylate cyclase domain-containing protein [Candidatus Competibacteraceae bacterium]
MTDSILQPIRILIADDDDAVLDVYRELFTTIAPSASASASALENLKAKLFGGAVPVPPQEAPFDPHYCHSAEQAIAAVRAAVNANRPFALVILDMRMPPGRDGAWAAARIREMDPYLDIVIATAHSDVDPRTITLQSPVFYIQKPFHPHELRQLALALGRKWVLEAHNRQLAYYDSLTGLPNRALFLDRLTQDIELARRYQRQAAVLFLDLDNFKRINDTLGHSFGDALLKTMAERLSDCLRACDTVTHPMSAGTAARLGGDEFTVLLAEIHHEDEAILVAQRILEAMGQPIELGSHEVIVTPSIGIALFPRDGTDVNTLIENADRAMYRAKRTGSNTFQCYRGVEPETPCGNSDEKKQPELIVEDHCPAPSRRSPTATPSRSPFNIPVPHRGRDTASDSRAACPSD